MSDHRPVLVGEAPSRRWGAFKGPWFDRLARMAGLPDALSLDAVFECVNLLDVPQSRQGRGSSFSPRQGELAARRLAPRLGGRRVLLLGRRVAGAFEVMPIVPYLATIAKSLHGAAPSSVVVVPHPSGVDRWWNSVRNRAAAVDLLTSEVTLV